MGKRLICFEVNQRDRQEVENLIIHLESHHSGHLITLSPNSKNSFLDHLMDLLSSIIPLKLGKGKIVLVFMRIDPAKIKKER